MYGEAAGNANRDADDQIVAIAPTCGPETRWP